jgi:AcrR family transcriptional regulator
MPRRYTLGKRAGQLAATRQRILNAATALYQERGATHTTIGEVAHRADVAPGTVLNHFESTDALARAVIAEVFGSLRLPDDGIFVGLDAVPQRVARLAHELFAFYDRSEPWYGIYARELSGIPAWADAEASFYAAFDRLIRTALGPLAEDASALAAVSTLLDGGVYSTIHARGLSSSDAAALVGEVLSPWLAGKAALR